MRRLARLVASVRLPVTDGRKVGQPPDGPQRHDCTDHRPAVYELAYQVGLRVTEGQIRTLEQVRTRVGAVVAITTTASAFLVGIAAGAKSSQQDWLYWSGIGVGIIIYGLLFMFAVDILKAKYSWHQNLSPKVIVEGYADTEPPATLAETHRHLALYLDQNFEQNQDNLDEIHRRWNWILYLAASNLALWASLAIRVG